MGLAAGMLLALPAAAMAQTYTVTRADDPDAGAGACAVGGACSLREAIVAANASPGQDLIVLPPGRFTRNRGLDGGRLTVTDPVQIAGSGARATVIDATADGHGQTQGLTVDAAGPVEVRDLTVTGAHDFVEGGGVWIGPSAVVTLRRVAISGNSVLVSSYPGEARGGGVLSLGDLTVLDSTIAGNRAEGSSSLVVGTGGGIRAAGRLTVVNSTVTGNFAHAGGGVYLDDATASFTGVTLADNSAGDDGLGGNLALIGPQVNATIAGSIVTGGSGLPAFMDCAGAARLTSLGGNVGTGIGCDFRSGDRAGTDPVLGPLANNGGPTDTMAIPPTSPALDVAGQCALPADQRGVPRYGPCDAGAVEVPSGSPPPAAPAAPAGPGAVAPAAAAPAIAGARVSPTSTSLRCTLRAAGNVRGVRVVIRCPRAVTATLAGTVLMGTRRAAIRPLSATLRAGHARTVAMRVPAAAAAAIRTGTRVRVTLTLSARGTPLATGGIARLRPPRLARAASR